jgi:predicted Zn-dependent protease
MRMNGWRGAIGAGALLFLAGCATFNPATGRQEYIFISTPEEIAMGEQMGAKIRSQEKLSKDEMAANRIAKIGQRLAQVSDRQDYQYRFYFIDKNEMNAFTIPGGQVYFYSGLYGKLKNNDEIAAVEAHEIGHCAARHVIKKYQASIGVNILSSLVFGQAGATTGAQLARMGADALVNIGMSAYSRADEYEADRLAVKYMVLAGYDPQAIITVLEVLGQASKGDHKDWMLLRSHPDLKDRIAAVRKEIELARTKY